MKSLSTKSLVFLGILMSTAIFTPSVRANTVDMITQMQNILEEYKTRILTLEAENRMLRNLMAQHEIQIPLQDYMSALGSGTTVTLNSAPATPAQTTTQTPASTADLTPFQLGFINQIHADWEGIKGAYQFPADAVLAVYEFVKDDAGNHVFASVYAGTGTQMGAYNYKLLYEVDPNNYSRKLIGLFEFSDAAKAYITRIGKNPFSKHERQFVFDPYRVTRTQTVVPPQVTQNQTQTPAPVNTAPAQTTPAQILSDLAAAYQAKDYTKTLRITDEYLASNPANYEILRYRYRVFFITKEYAKSLAEIKKMEDMGIIDAMTYCDAHVVATWAGNTSLANTYKSKAGSACKTN